MMAYFLPVALQALSQALTYPLVSMVGAAGPEGPLNIAAISQSNALVFLIQTTGLGMFTSGMVYATTAQAYRTYCRLNAWVAIGALAVHGLFCLPPVSRLLFGSLMGLTAELEEATARFFLYCLPMTLVFNIRNPSMAILFNQRRTSLAYAATLTRIGGCAAMVAACRLAGVGGLAWAAAALTVPLAFEGMAMRVLARPSLLALPAGEGRPPLHPRELLGMASNLTLGRLLLCVSSYVGGAFAARAPAPDAMLPVFYAALALVTPASFAAFRLQTLAIACGGGSAEGRRRLWEFSLLAGGGLSLLPLLAVAPGVIIWYYGDLQRLPSGLLPAVRDAALLLAAVPMLTAVRSVLEGEAARLKTTRPILVSQAFYLAGLSAASGVSLWMGAPAYGVGAAGLVAANASAAAWLAFAGRARRGGAAHARAPAPSAAAET